MDIGFSVDVHDADGDVFIEDLDDVIIQLQKIKTEILEYCK